MKDKYGEKVMTEFVGLQSKLYSFRVQGDKNDKKEAQGIKQITLKTITFNGYKQTLFSRQNLIKSQCLILSRKHGDNSIKKSEIALSWHDDKKMIFTGKTDTPTWGYKQKNNSHFPWYPLTLVTDLTIQQGAMPITNISYCL